MIRDVVGVIGIALIICGAVPIARQELRISRRKEPFDVNQASLAVLRFSLPVVGGFGIAMWAYSDLGLWGALACALVFLLIWLFCAFLAYFSYLGKDKFYRDLREWREKGAPTSEREYPEQH